MKNYVIVFILFALPFVMASNAKAATTCTPIYGGGQSCVTTAGNVEVVKRVQVPERDQNGNLKPTANFADSLGFNSPRFRPNEQVTFEIIVRNTGNVVIPMITVTDTLPTQANRNVQGPGTFDGSRTVTFFIQNLQAGAAQTEKITATIVDGGQLPDAVTCPNNNVIANGNQGQSSSDNSQFCIEKQVLGATPAPGKGGVVVTPGVTKGGLKVFPPPAAVTTPPTGPEALALAALIPTGILGQFLRRKSAR